MISCSYKFVFLCVCISSHIALEPTACCNNDSVVTSVALLYTSVVWLQFTFCILFDNKVCGLLLQGTVVYINFGRESDFKYLEALHIGIEKSILLARLGKVPPGDLVSWRMMIVNVEFWHVWYLSYSAIIQLVSCCYGTSWAHKSYCYWAIAWGTAVCVFHILLFL